MKNKNQHNIKKLKKKFLKNWIKAVDVMGSEYYEFNIKQEKLHKAKDVSQIQFNPKLASCTSYKDRLSFGMLVSALSPHPIFKEFILNGTISKKNKKIARNLLETSEKLKHSKINQKPLK